MEGTARYAITYFDPEDPEGMRERTWAFGTLEEAEEWRGELGAVWRSLLEGQPSLRAVPATATKPRL